MIPVVSGEANPTVSYSAIFEYSYVDDALQIVAEDVEQSTVHAFTDAVQIWNIFDDQAWPEAGLNVNSDAVYNLDDYSQLPHGPAILAASEAYWLARSEADTEEGMPELEWSSVDGEEEMPELDSDDSDRDDNDGFGPAVDEVGGVKFYSLNVDALSSLLSSKPLNHAYDHVPQKWQGIRNNCLGSVATPENYSECGMSSLADDLEFDNIVEQMAKHASMMQTLVYMGLEWTNGDKGKSRISEEGDDVDMAEDLEAGAPDPDERNRRMMTTGTI